MTLALFALFMAALLTSVATPAANANSKYSAIVIDAETGTVLFSRKSESSRYPASLTKIMTLYLTFEALDTGKLKLDQKLTVSKRASGQAPSKLWLQPGEKITVEEAIHALVTKSANDVATVLSEAVAGTEYQFTLEMTQKARSLGMRNTRFMNASGLPNRRQKSTASDLAILGQRISDDFPQYYHYFSVKSFSWKGKTYKSHNSLLKNYKGTDGIKTGYTRASGFNLTTSVERDGHRLIGVVLGGKSAKSRDAHMKYILDKTFNRLSSNPSLVPQLTSVPSPRPKPTELYLADSRPTRKPSYMFGVSEDGAPELAVSLDGVSTLRLSTGENIISYDPPAAEQGDLTPTELGAQWGIQIGAFSEAEKARNQLEATQKMDPHRLSMDKTVIAPFETVEGEVYRARFGPMAENKARDACKALTNKGVSCFAVHDSDWLF